MERYRKILEALDIPSGTILGLFTLIIMGMSVDAFLKGKDIPPTVVDAYKFVVASFAGSKAVQTVWGKPKE